MTSPATTPVLQCPECGQHHALDSLAGASSFRCRRCHRLLKVPAQLRPPTAAPGASVNLALESSEPPRPAALGSLAALAAPPLGAPPPGVAPPGVAPPGPSSPSAAPPAAAPTQSVTGLGAARGPDAPASAPPSVSAPGDAATTARVAAATTATVSPPPRAPAGMTGSGAPEAGAAGAPPPTAPPPRPGVAPRVSWLFRLAVWVVAVPLGIGITFLAARAVGLLSRKDLEDLFLDGAWGRFAPVARLLPVCALVIAGLVQLAIVLALRRKARRAAKKAARSAAAA